LWQHCRSFDEGNEDAALDIAVRLRVLFHTTKASTSALTYLSAEHIRLLSAASDSTGSSGKVFIHEGGLTILRNNRWVAALDRATHRRETPFRDW